MRPCEAHRTTAYAGPVTDVPLRALTEPRAGLPEVVTAPAGLLAAAASLQAGTGPVAVDSERASGYRYGQSAYLIQLRRAGSGTWLIDPAACPDLTAIHQALDGVEWILHAASQDLPCLAERGMSPTSLFDTELAARLAGLPRVGLGAVVEQLLGLTLAKEHSAVDWSTRPLPVDWLRYAALDVEVLIELRTELTELLAAQGKLDWAAEEFAAIVAAPPATPRVDPWRRLSGLHRLRNRRQLAIARELWQAREKLAQKRDIAPGRIIVDATLVAAAAVGPKTLDELLAVPGFSTPASGRQATWVLSAIKRGQGVPQTQLPPNNLPSDAPPPPRAWADRNPLASHRLAYARTELAQLGAELSIPVENLCTPDTIRRLLWDPPTDLTAALRTANARNWQISLVQPILAAALTQELPAPALPVS